jgi:hypothetical protein
MVEGLGISADEHPPRRLLLDLPSVDPALNFSRIAEALADIIVRSEPHFALGLFGGWGSGKTTLMRAIEQRLRRSNVVCVQFNAWRYEKEEHLLIPLLDTIRDALVDWGSTQADDSLAQRTATRIGQVARTLVAGTTISLGVPGAVELSYDASRVLEEEGRRRSARRDAIQDGGAGSFYHASFRALARAFHDFVGGDGSPRMVVFVDDLDRCLPENALQVLESMKLFLDLDGFVFVVGLDDDIVEALIDAKYGTSAAGEPSTGRRISGAEYISKMFQLPYRLPPLSLRDLDTFLSATYEEGKLGSEQWTELETVVKPHLRYLVADGWVNPRELKRYINLFTLQREIDSDLDPNVVLTLLTMRSRGGAWKSVHDALLEFREEFLVLLRERTGAGASTTALPDLPPLPDSFVEYIAPDAPGHALLSVEDLHPYLHSSGATGAAQSQALLDALAHIGRMRRALQVAREDEMEPDALESAVQSSLAAVEETMSRAGVPPVGASGVVIAIEDVRGRVDEGKRRGDLLGSVPDIAAAAGTLSERVRRLYRLGDSSGPVVLKPSQQRWDESHHIGRNDPCWCGSGNKFKKCHGA